MKNFKNTITTLLVILTISTGMIYLKQTQPKFNDFVESLYIIY